VAGRFGISAGRTALEQVRRVHPSQTPQPLPPGGPAVADAASLGVHDSAHLTFFVVGDSGGIANPTPQNAVSYAMQRSAAAPPAFVYHVGDVVYFHGEPANYTQQFYEPYGHLAAPILAIPGNHDGDVARDDAGQATGRAPLDAFMANFCAAKAGAPAGDLELEYGRHTQTQPWCDWTPALRAITIIGLYTNVPEGGHLEPRQTAWLVEQLRVAHPQQPLVVALHHPCFSVDAHHGGSARMADALTAAFRSAGRYPQMVLSGHVHDYQRFTWKLDGHTIRTIVVGSSGYHNLHRLAADARPGMDLGNGVTFEYGDASEYGFLTLSVKSGRISGTYTGVKPGTMPDGSDARVTVDKDTF
jgi:hypothetical protein